ncbi:MAG: glycosyltransferase [Jannaschia sp.]
MRRRLSSLFARYASRAMVLEGRVGPVKDTEDVTLTTLRLSGGTIEIAGQAGPGPLRLSLASASVRTMARADAPFRLNLTVPAGADPREARLRTPSTDTPLPWRHGARSRASALVRFVATMTGAVPDILRWLRHRDMAAKARIKRALLLDAVLAGQDLPTDLWSECTSGRVAGPLTIILPIHDAHDLLSECLARIARNTLGDWTLIAVDDASSDPRIRTRLRAFRDTDPRLRLIELDENLGFVGAVNVGLAEAEAPGHAGPVVLLNSDALVPEGWDARLLEPFADGTVASVTPMSNDAEIFGLPAICGAVTLGPDAVDRIDAVARMLSPTAAQAEAPTGVGFCMALSRDWLSRVPRLDAAFGRGYGEEVDWCQRVRALGGRNVGTGTVFVEHRGGGSFAPDVKAAQIASNSALISGRYPAYDTEVQAFITADPLAGPRLALACAWAETARSDAPVPIFLAHWLGGGAEAWLRERIASRSRRNLPTIILRVGGPCAWQLEVAGPGGVTACRTDDFSAIERLLAPVEHRRVIYSNGVGAVEPLNLPKVLLSLAAGQPLEILFHDFHPICRDIALSHPGDRYRGPRVGQDGAGWHPPMEAGWTAAWAQALAQADRFVCFSAESGRILSLARPDLAGRIEVRPHAVRPLERIGPRRPGLPRVLAALGNLAEHKGARVLSDLSRDWARRFPGARLSLFGDIDPEFSLARSARMHGAYAPEALPDLARRHGVTHWIVPSICPETFSFTTHEALSTGLPVLAFDIGAQGAAVLAAPNGIAVRWDPDRDPADLIRDALAAEGF